MAQVFEGRYEGNVCVCKVYAKDPALCKVRIPGKTCKPRTRGMQM